MVDLVDKLKTAGFDQKQSEAVIRVIVQSQDGLTTKADLIKANNDIKADISVRFERVDGDPKLKCFIA